MSGSFTRAIYDTSRARLTVEKVEYTRTRVWPPTVLFPRIDDRRSKQSIAINRPVRALRLGNCARVHQWRRVAFSFFFFFARGTKYRYRRVDRKFRSFTVAQLGLLSCHRTVVTPTYLPIFDRAIQSFIYIYTYIFTHSFLFSLGFRRDSWRPVSSASSQLYNQPFGLRRMIKMPRRKEDRFRALVRERF